MRWIGKWRNQYGSVVDITDDADRRITGTFSTALRDSGFYGEAVAIVGVHQGDCVSFTFARGGPTGDVICSFTGLARDGKIYTLWHVVADSALRAKGLEKIGWAHAAQTNADTFERMT